MGREAMMLTKMAEEFKPIPIRRADGRFGKTLFELRMLVDLQLLTCTRFLAPVLSKLRGRVLDVGCGEMPFRGFLPMQTSYTGIDLPTAGDFGMRRHAQIVAFDGRHIPFPDGAFDHVLCTEVLEHASEPDALVAEMWRVLRPGGTLVATVPFSARVHHAPHDFHRFTRYRLDTLFARFGAVDIEERGDDLAVIANKLVVVCVRLTLPSAAWAWRLPLLALTAPAALLALGVAHISLRWGLGSKSDPLGYGVVARKD
jgi:SAM-dependent methyltransferase